MVPSYRGTPCFLACVTGLVQSLVPVARPIKLATPMGATLGNSVQCRSPTVAWMMAVGSAAAAGGVTGAFGVEAACALAKRDAEIIRTRVCNKVRMDAPESI